MHDVKFLFGASRGGTTRCSRSPPSGAWRNWGRAATLPAQLPRRIAAHPRLYRADRGRRPLQGQSGEYIHEIKIKAWRYNFIEDPRTDVAGVGWVRANLVVLTSVLSFRRPSPAISPAFYLQPGGGQSADGADRRSLLPRRYGRIPLPKNEFLVFEDGTQYRPYLQCTTYRDAASAAFRGSMVASTRLWTISPPEDRAGDRCRELLNLPNSFQTGQKAPREVSYVEGFPQPYQLRRADRVGVREKCPSRFTAPTTAWNGSYPSGLPISRDL